VIQSIGLGEHFQENPINLMVKTHGFPVDFPNKTNPMNVTSTKRSSTKRDARYAHGGLEEQRSVLRVPVLKRVSLVTMYPFGSQCCW